MGDPKGMKGGPEDPSAWGGLRMCALQAWVTCPSCAPDVSVYGQGY